MTYNEIEEKYIKAGITNYKFKNALEVKKVLGYDFRTMRGYKALSEEEKEMAERFICNYLNGWGLEARENIRPTSITREDLRCRFKLTIKNKGFSYLYDNGTVG